MFYADVLENIDHAPKENMHTVPENFGDAETIALGGGRAGAGGFVPIEGQHNMDSRASGEGNEEEEEEEELDDVARIRSTYDKLFEEEGVEQDVDGRSLTPSYAGSGSQAPASARSG